MLLVPTILHTRHVEWVLNKITENNILATVLLFLFYYGTQEILCVG